MNRLGILLALAIAMPVHAAADLQEILQCMRANVPETLRVRKIELTATDRAGATRTLQGRLFAKREQTAVGEAPVRAMLRIEAPPYLAGASYLVREVKGSRDQGMYVFLPSVHRVRRVTGALVDGSLLGTNFSYNDFKQLETAFAGATAKLEGADSIGQRAVHVLSFNAVPSPGARYSSVRAWIDRQTCVPLQAEFYIGKTARKRLVASEGALRQAGDSWYLSEIEMRDLQDGTKTVLRVLDVAAGGSVPGSYFDPQLFYLGK